jgi:hypothetical protein
MLRVSVNPQRGLRLSDELETVESRFDRLVRALACA